MCRYCLFAFWVILNPGVPLFPVELFIFHWLRVVWYWVMILNRSELITDIFDGMDRSLIIVVTMLISRPFMLEEWAAVTVLFTQ